ncbi:unnamed protein product [Vicia faba]|uniref:Uncharacterized protein n=1 Tax=Vicia faba TaxID=3906 RepID=A0AAV1B8G7_VICFA|nr:unnamed protein product [Vicia faba]
MKRNGKDGWISLGGIFLCITGTEAMFADLGHFDVHAIQFFFYYISCISMRIQCGQADQIGNTFYNSIPDPIFWPTFVVAVSAAIIANCAAFRTTDNIGHAYGIAVCIVMLVTTCMVALIMLVIWKTSILWIALSVVIFGLIEIVYLSSMLTKFVQGEKGTYLSSRSGEYVRELVSKRVVSRIPGVSLIYSELVEGVPPIFAHVISNLPHIHSVVVFVSMKSIPISKVGLDERFLFRQIQPKEYRIFRCVVRYGYNDVIGEPNEFEQQLVEQLKEFISDQNVTYLIEGVGGTDADQTNNNLFVTSQQQSNSDDVVKDSKGSSNRIAPAATSSYQGVVVSGASSDSIHSFGMTSRISNQNLQGVEEEISFVQRAMEKSVVYMLGEAEVVAEPNSSILKKIVVNHNYNFLRRNFRQGDNLMQIPRSRLLKIGMIYEI